MLNDATVQGKVKKQIIDEIKLQTKVEFRIANKPNKKVLTNKIE